MTLNQQQFTLYDIQRFPIVSMRNQATAADYVKQWEKELNELLAQAQPFVIIFPPDGGKKESIEDHKCQLQWFRINKERFGKVCRALISIAPNSKERQLQQDYSKMMSYTFGTEVEIVSSLAQALQLSRRFVA